MPAVAIDVALLLLFAVQHSVMARRPVKSWLRRRTPAALERTTYVLATDICLALLLAALAALGRADLAPRRRGRGRPLVAVRRGLGAGDRVDVRRRSPRAHRAAAGRLGGPRGSDGGRRLQVGGLHGVVRHPLMTGLLLAFWATPQMGASHLLFALAATGYVAVGIAFEERDLRRTFGATYDDYAARVPALVPRIAPGRSSLPSHQSHW